ncbi:GNAT family N-acetyltransferase [Subtercola frigoramans]|uniref:GNAT superfamily N-acetyltransferase n=1 Tax=Subtercola frigoramans TaxID=120298 RepID=A0ABS2L4M6_9MICO|nr:GNAT family N-acetyltransferase [Subtercola frigoramans]MBM7472027.1 GNAT superfamily N-acetyltransferase [Subtercola frigoramans]
MHLREAAVTEPDSIRLLGDYFGSRELEFTEVGGVYTTRFPEAETFTPPAGVFLLVIDDDNAAVGCGGIRLLPQAAADNAPGTAGERARQLEAGTVTEATPVRFEVKHVWLSEAARGKGWAIALMNELERRAHEFGATQLVLDTNARLTAAARLYTRLGYEQTEPYNDNANATNWYAKQLS